MWHFLVNGGWILFLVAFAYGGWILFVYIQQARWGSKQSFMFLAIDIPKNNIQTPRAVENIFVALAGAHSPLEWGEKKFEGKYQLGFSFELVSIDGYVQFIVMTPVHFRNLVEASFYSQYPDAEITEVEDYLKDINVTFPSDEYNLWGSDMVMVNKDYYPIRSYREFQEELDNEFKDPMAALLEIMNTIGPGEQIWIQLIILPADNDWMWAGRKAISKIMGIPERSSETMIDKILNSPLKAVQAVNEHLGIAPPAGPGEREDKFDINRLTPIEKREVEAIAMKIDKINFNCKYRYIYFGKKEVFKKALGVSGVMGAIKQYTSTGLNAFKPGKNKTQARLMFAKYRLARLQNRMFQIYKDRNPDTTVGLYTLSAEELATLYHFPYIEVKAPLVKTIDAKRGSAPIGLPTEEVKKLREDIPTEAEAASEESPDKVIDYDNDYFEQRFAVDKTGESDRKRKEEVMKQLRKEGPSAGSGQSKEQVNNETKEEESVEKDSVAEEPISVENKLEEDDDGDEGVPSNLPFV